MKDDPFYNGLIERYLNNHCTPEEVKELFDYLKTNNSNKLLLKKIEEEFKTAKPVVAEYEGRIREQLRKKIAPARVISIRKALWPRIAVAVSVLLVLSIAGYLVVNKKDDQTIAENTKPVQKTEIDIAPGGNKAILTLADGSQIVLDTTGNGAVTKQGGVTIIKLDGQLAYNKGDNNSNEVLYNTITTPKGGQYRLVLSDGSRIWLNAASSITYPTAFMQNERKVAVTGEAYFEVAHDPSKPFTVSVNGMNVEVLGTHFNINAYADESLLKTTLLQGKVKITKADKSVILQPGQQAATYIDGANDNTIAINKNIDVEAVTAWKNGLFNFEHSDIDKILREFARWYDVEIHYEGKRPAKKFFGIVNRKSSLSSVLKALKAGGPTHLNYTIVGKKLIVQSTDKN